MILVGHSGGQPRVDGEQPRTQHADPEVCSVTGMNKEVWRVSEEEDLSAGRCETVPACWFSELGRVSSVIPYFWPLQCATVPEVTASNLQ